jgi:Tol biopolymer transport system component
VAIQIYRATWLKDSLSGFGLVLEAKVSGVRRVMYLHGAGPDRLVKEMFPLSTDESRWSKDGEQVIVDAPQVST